MASADLLLVQSRTAAVPGDHVSSQRTRLMDAPAAESTGIRSLRHRPRTSQTLTDAASGKAEHNLSRMRKAG